MSTAQRIVVDPITRIEGHLRIEAETDASGKITSAYSAGTMVRGIEIILRGRDPRDAWAFAQRICGVCTWCMAWLRCARWKMRCIARFPPTAFRRMRS
jgi:hydrogenase large subunit